MVIGVARVVGSTGLVMPADKGMAIRVETVLRPAQEVASIFGLLTGACQRASRQPLANRELRALQRETGPQCHQVSPLDEGVVRSITGSWGEAARDRSGSIHPWLPSVSREPIYRQLRCGQHVRFGICRCRVDGAAGGGAPGYLGTMPERARGLLSGDMKGQMREQPPARHGSTGTCGRSCGRAGASCGGHGWGYVTCGQNS